MVSAPDTPYFAAGILSNRKIYLKFDFGVVFWVRGGGGVCGPDVWVNGETCCRRSMDGGGWGEESYDSGGAGGWGEASFLEAEEDRGVQRTEKIPFPASVKDLSLLPSSEEKITSGKYTFTTVRILSLHYMPRRPGDGHVARLPPGSGRHLWQSGLQVAGTYVKEMADRHWRTARHRKIGCIIEIYTLGA